MNINFDIISDLRLDSIKDINWEHKATSLFCLVAGNVSSNHDVVFDFLEHIKNYYRGVFFIDGDLEHQEADGDFEESYYSLRNGIEEIENVFFLHENVIVLDNVILVGTNGWTSFNFTDESLIESNMNFLIHKGSHTEHETRQIFKMAVTDQSYLHQSLITAEDIPECANIVIVTNCVPRYEIIEKDADYRDTITGDLIGSSGIHRCLESDQLNRNITWVFGRYPKPFDETIDDVRYISNPAISKDFDIYYPTILKF